MRIRHSLHSRHVGVGDFGVPTASVKPSEPPWVSKGGYVSGEHGSQFWMPGPKKVVLFDDFTGDVLADQWNYVEGTDASPTDAAILATGKDGILQFTTGNAGTGLAADLAQLTSALQWKANAGGLEMQVKIKLSRITLAYAFIGFTDLVTLEAPIISAASADTFTTNASDAVGFMFDTRMTTDDWWLTGVKADTDATMQDAALAPVADTFAEFRVEVSTAGAATFFYNGAQIGTVMSSALTAATALTPTVAVGNVSGTTEFTADLDYVYVAQNRG